MNSVKPSAVQADSVLPESCDAMKLYLASKSPRRNELLQMITTNFSVINSTFNEKEVPLSKPEAYVKQLAFGKASHTSYNTDENAIIIGCDTIVVSPEGIIFGKPKNYDDAFSMLKTLSGQTHSVITGVCLYSAGRAETFAVKTAVTFYPLSDDEIHEYLFYNEYVDKAGAYGIQGKGGLLCKKIEGDYFNIVGLPVASLSRALKSCSFANNI